MDPNLDILSAMKAASQKLFEATGAKEFSVILPDALVPELLRRGMKPIWDPKARCYCWGRAGSWADRCANTIIYTHRSS